MRTTTPDEQGWYWAETTGNEWLMAFVDTSKKFVSFWESDRRVDVGLCCIGEDMGIRCWFGPLACPAGPCGVATVVLPADLHDKAELSGEALYLRHADYSHCRDGLHGGQITAFGSLSREQVDRLLADGLHEPASPRQHDTDRGSEVLPTGMESNPWDRLVNSGWSPTGEPVDHKTLIPPKSGTAIERKRIVLAAIADALENCSRWEANFSCPSVIDDSFEAVEAMMRDGCVRRKPGPLMTIMLTLRMKEPEESRATRGNCDV